MRVIVNDKKSRSMARHSHTSIREISRSKDFECQQNVFSSVLDYVTQPCGSIEFNMIMFDTVMEKLNGSEVTR